VLLYAPRLKFPAVFALWTVTVPIPGLGTGTEVPLLWTVYGLILAAVEIVGLVVLNVRAVRRVAGACRFPASDDPECEAHERALVAISVEKDVHRELTLGLNPWQGYSQARVTLIVLLSRLKATLSNLLVKMLVRRLLGRYAVRLFVDFAGVPVMAAWNAYATKRILDEALARIFAPALVRHCTEAVHRRRATDPVFAACLYDLLQYGSMQKRAFQENHFLLAKGLLDAFGVPIRSRHEVGDDFLPRLATMDAAMRSDVVGLILTGMILDGRISWSERRAIRRLNAVGLLRLGPPEVQRIATRFMQGDDSGALARDLGVDA
jgi:hypothetical protein